jgi:hypothetical protein
MAGVWHTSTRGTAVMAMRAVLLAVALHRLSLANTMSSTIVPTTAAGMPALCPMHTAAALL